MPVLKNLPGRLKGRKGSGEVAKLRGELILRKMSLNPFEEVDREEEAEENENSSLRGGTLGGKNPFEEEEEENEVNEERRSLGGRNSPLRGTLERMRSPLKTLGKLGKGLRMSGRSRGENSPASRHPSDITAHDKKKHVRRSSEEIVSLLRLPGKRKESLPNGDPLSPGEKEETEKRRTSFLKMVRGGKTKNPSEKGSPEPEEEKVVEQPEVKPKEPLSVLEILQLVTKRDLFLADTHILELERECEEAALGGPGTPTAGGADEATSPTKDGGRRKAKDVELLYEALQKELWDVVRESLRCPNPGSTLGLVVQVVEQEEAADQDWVQKEGGQQGPRPRQLKRKWKEAVAGAANGSLPQHEEAQSGQLAGFLGQLRTRVVEDLGAASRNVVSIYPDDYNAFNVYVQSYHQAIGQRLQNLTRYPLTISDNYALLDWIHNTYNREVLANVSLTRAIDRTSLGPVLPLEIVEKLEQDCISSVRDKVTTELLQVLEEEERRWTGSRHIEEYQSTLASTVIKRLQVDLDKSATITRDLGSRVAQCCLTGLAEFLSRFQRKVEFFHETQMEFGQQGDGYISKTIALVNCCPPFRAFVRRCTQCEPAECEEATRRANASLDKIVNQGVRVLTDRLFDHIKPYFDKLVKRKWLNNTEAFDTIQETIKIHFKRFRRMDSPPYLTLVNDIHRRVLTEYLRAIMRGRVICTSLKMRKRMASRLREEAGQLKALFKDLESEASWLDNAIPLLSEIIVLEDTPSIQMEVGVLVREYPDIRKKHISAVLNIRGMMRQVERQEILNIAKDFENSDSLTQLSRDRALFSEVPVTSEVHCLNLGLSRLALTTSSCLSLVRSSRKSSRRREAPEDQL
ncbi:tumor necrosis factor alpha-induced protein 2 [Lepisosteus oculatus]|uniref:tumor necrosis factor alpha-induced protein 2 n=1 Tax=Lepisosteus oculatus TaxID=7918 RepID=UPI00371F2363